MTTRPNKTTSKTKKASTPRKSSKLYIVGIGASAGGLEAVNAFFDQVPEDSGLSFVLVQHLSPDYKSMMPELLARHTKLKIEKAAHNMLVNPNTIYTIPADKNMTVVQGRLRLEERESPKTLNLPINIFFKSLAEDQEQRAIGIILSGTGSDGTLGMESIKEHGGMVIAQDPYSAAFDSMPKSAIATGLVDFILKPEVMPTTIINYVKHPYVKTTSADLLNIEAGDEILRMLTLIHQKTNMDFRHYKKSTIIRRIERRMGIRNILSRDLYLKYLHDNPEEIELLSNDMLIGVTGFFRDNKAFELLDQEVIAPMVKQAQKDKELRVWAVGCSTGEEVYSIAILLKERFKKFRKNLPVKIFATDIDQRAIDRASKGVYTEAIFEEVPRPLVNRYFKKLDNSKYQVDKGLREMIIFARHDVAKDPPFNNIDLACCRNLLIYIEPPLQEKILSFIHFSLNENGFLFLGSSETLGSYSKVFDEIDKKHKLFRNRSSARITDIHKLYPFETRKPNRKGDETGNNQLAVLSETKIISNFKDALLEDMVPPTVIINENNDVVHVAGEVEKYIKLPKKQLTLNVLKMVDEQLYVPLSNVISKIRKERKKITSPVVSFENDSKYLINIIGKLYIEPVSRINYCIITFAETNFIEPQGRPAGKGKTEATKEKDAHIMRLEEELKESKEHLQATIEELETSNEELQATNEELMAANEELQSSNEELQSVNEELYTVNNEFQDKLAEMTDLNDDLNNFIQSTQIATLFLDMDFNIKRFTDAIVPLIKITSNDTGRYIGDLTHSFLDFNLVETARELVDNLQPVERELVTNKGEFFLLRAKPYRTAKKDVNGTVFTWFDVTDIKLAEEQLKLKAQELEQFAYIASHDLQEPLRSVVSYLQLLQEQNQGKLDGESESYIDVAIEGAKRMKRLMEGLLTYSRVESGAKAFEKVDLNEVMVLLKKDLLIQIKESEASLEIDELPVVNADSTQMRLLFQNLITNGIKFRKEDTKPLIKVEVRQVENTWEFAVKDNGIGIEKEFYERIFVIFQRLHTRQEYEGTGIGLAICKKIVERHGGQIWIESQLEKGTTVHFTIPM